MSAQKLDDKEVEALLRSGWSQTAIVRLYKERGIDITQSAISQAIACGRIKVDMGVNYGVLSLVTETRAPTLPRGQDAAHPGATGQGHGDWSNTAEAGGDVDRGAGAGGVGNPLRPRHRGGVLESTPSSWY